MFSEPHEDTPLINDTEDAQKKHQSGGSFIGSMFTVITCAIGSGILTLPSAFKECGIILAILFLVMMSIINLYSLHLLITSSTVTGKRTYQEVAKAAYGKLGIIATDVMLVVSLFGSMVGFTIIIGELMSPVVCHWTGHAADCAAAHTIWVRTDFLSFLFIACIVTPLAFFTKMHHFQWSSAIAFGTVLFVIFSVTFRAISYMAQDWSHFKFPPLFHFSAVGTGNSLPLIAFALGCHSQIIPIYGDLKPRIRNLRVMDTIITTSNTLTTCLYLVMSLAGYFHFGSAVDGNVLVNYNASDMLILIARLMMVFHVTLAFPLMIWPCRNIIDQLLFGGESSVDGEHKIDEDNNLFGGDIKKTIRHIFLTITIVGLAYGTAVLIPNITLVFGFTGSVAAVCTNFVFPAAIYLRLMWISHARYPNDPLIQYRISRRAPAIGLLILGLFIGVFSTAMLTYQAVHDYHHKN